MAKVTNNEIHNITNRCREIEDSFGEFVVDRTQFKLMSAKDIRQLSVCEITSPSPIDNGGISDHRMGPGEEGCLCETCHKTLSCCPGHYGHIELKYPVINPEMKSCVLSILSCVCNYCSSLLFPKSIIEGDREFESKKGFDRINMLKEYSSKYGKCTRKLAEGEKPCYPSPTYKTSDNKEGHMVQYVCHFKTGKKASSSNNVKTVSEILEILDNIKDSDMSYLGLDPVKSPHPRDFIFQALIVPPPAFRPPLIQDGEKKPDFVTKSYINIITTNEKLKKVGINENERTDYERKMESHIYQLISATGETNLSKAGGIKSLKKRLNGKEGFPRKMAMGKRIDQAGRSVIGGDSTLPFGWISIPEIFANVLTKKEKVTYYNIERMRKLYNEGKITHNTSSGGKFAGKTMMISDIVKAQLMPRIGDMLDVRLMDGDVVTFNRQPTLHKSGIMAFRALIHDGKTIKIHSSITEATNADFDGDDANIYMHQDIKTVAENLLLANVTNNIANSHRSGVMTGLYYNACLGAYLLSHDNVILNDDDWNEGIALFRRSVSNYKLKPQLSVRFRNYEDRIRRSGIHPRSGKALISAMFPPDMNMNYGGAVVRNGILIRGILKSSNLNGFGLVHTITKNYDIYVARQFITESQWLFDWYLSIRGCSTSLSDIMPPNRKEVKEFVMAKMETTQHMVNAFYKEEIKEELREMKILNALGRAEDGGKKLATKFLSPDNPYVAIYSSGAKGSPNNMKCMMAMYGQEVNGGQRPKFTISDRSRFCCFNDFNDIDVTARGYITDSFVDGLSPCAFIMHMDSARDGINSSNLATPDAGFMGRKLNNFLNNIRIGSMREVEMTNQNLIQFSYGDGVDPAKATLNSSLIRGTEKYFINIDETINSILGSVIEKRLRHPA